ncbi:hypothetical protein H6P81_008826 [Aristolochia fimbriata]|uniref:WPP domain-interacting protein 2 n=1 Tax=Aristolochia fimbriata TaxID=158543 RepID=A0AAV7EMF8_ARIFI|nr:hypothetical protein H6P81_008826 [Aristolochia fimbriata]
MENVVDSDGGQVDADVDPVENSSPSVESRLETNGASVGDDGGLDFGESGKIEIGGRSFASDEMREELNGVQVNKIGDSVDVEPVLEITQDFGRTKVGINGSCVNEMRNVGGSFSPENKAPGGINGGTTRNGKIVETGNAEIRSPSKFSEEQIAATQDGLAISTEEPMMGQPQENARSSPEVKLESNGSSPSELEKVNVRESETGNTAESSPKDDGSPSGSSVTSPTTKGYGLKKWRRIRRDSVKDTSSTADLNRILKRGLSSAAEPVKGRLASGEILEKGESSVASMTSVIKNLGVSSLPVGVSDSESRLAKGAMFAVGTDSENSEDRSSKSSTATSAAKLREVPIAMGTAKEKSKAKNPSGRMSANTGQRGQQGKGKVEPSKKPRGDRAKTENENSYSSVESDLRSSASVFAQMSGFAETSNEVERERSFTYEEENSDEGQAYEPQSSEEVRTGSFEENGEDLGDVSKEDLAVNTQGEKEQENRDGVPSEKDPLLESMFLLQVAQEALEKEIQKFGEIGKESVSLADVASHGISLSGKVATVYTGTAVPNSSDQLHFEEMEESSSTPVESRMNELTQRINTLECSLEEARVSLKSKETKVSELESILSGSQMPKEERDTKVETLKETCKEMENDLENLFMKKIEAEIEYLTLSGTNRKWKVAVEDRTTDLIEGEKCFAMEQAQLIQKLSDTRRKATLLEEEAHEMEASSRELVRLKELLSARNNLCKSALLCFLQFVLLCIAVWWFLLQLLPPPPEFVPT